jgi:uncharacterized protein with PQ loop repeat
MSVQWLGYVGTTLVALAYLPQIHHLIRERCSAGLSIRAYECWLVASVLLASYAVAVRDPVFIALQGYQLAAASIICFLSKKYQGMLCEDHDGTTAADSTLRTPGLEAVPATVPAPTRAHKR